MEHEIRERKHSAIAWLAGSGSICTRRTRSHDRKILFMTSALGAHPEASRAGPRKRRPPPPTRLTPNVCKVNVCLNPALCESAHEANKGFNLNNSVFELLLATSEWVLGSEATGGRSRAVHPLGTSRERSFSYRDASLGIWRSATIEFPD